MTALRWKLPMGLLLPTAWLLGTGLLATERLLLAQAGLPWNSLTVIVPWWPLAGAAAWRIRSTAVLGHGRSQFRRGALFSSMRRSEKEETHLNSLTMAVEMVVVVIIVLWTLSLFRRTLNEPLMGWDALIDWVLKGRVIFRAGTVPFGFFTDPHYASFAHMDYPLLVPLTVARIYSWMGDQDVVVKGWWCLLAGSAAAGLYYGLAGPVNQLARLGGLLLVIGIPAMTIYGADELAGYAELPLAVFLLYAALFLYRWLQSRANEELALSAIFFGLAGFTKNEGLVLGVVGLAALLVLALVRRVIWRRDIMVGFFVASVILLPWQVEIQVLHIQGDLHPTVADIMANLPQRMGPILARLTYNATDLSLVSATWVLLPLLSLSVLLFAPKRWLVALPVLLVIMAHLAITIAAYITTPFDLDWHLRTSSDRLLVQITLVAALLGVIYTGILLDRPARET
jgi:hypothetical protein